MKPTLLLLLLCLNAFAQPLTNNSQRVIQGRPVSIKPLQDWWAETQRIIASNEKRPKKEQDKLPPKVFSGWVRLTTSEVTNTPYGAIANAKIQYAPGEPATNCLLVLRNGPMNEKRQVDTAISDLKQTIGERDRARSKADANRDAASQYRYSANFYYSLHSVAPSLGFGSDGAHYSYKARQADRAASQAQNRANYLEQQRDSLMEYTKGRTVYTVDDFALRTPELYKGLPVYNMGYYNH